MRGGCYCCLVGQYVNRIYLARAAHFGHSGRVDKSGADKTYRAQLCTYTRLVHIKLSLSQQRRQKSACAVGLEPRSRPTQKTKHCCALSQETVLRC